VKTNNALEQERGQQRRVASRESRAAQLRLQVRQVGRSGAQFRKTEGPHTSVLAQDQIDNFNDLSGPLHTPIGVFFGIPDETGINGL
jgi:hypothetical protein